MSSNRADWVKVEGVIEHETENAILLDVHTVGKEWFPLSAVNEIHKGKGTQSDYILVDSWIAKKKGLQE